MRDVWGLAYHFDFQNHPLLRHSELRPGATHHSRGKKLEYTYPYTRTPYFPVIPSERSESRDLPA